MLESKQRVRSVMITLLAILPAVAAPGCGGDAAQVATVVTTTATTATAGASNANAPTSTASLGSYPNLDEATVAAVRTAALSAYGQAYGDGSGASEVWGPNIIGDWALMGVENFSGSAGQDVLLHRENGAWQVKEIGHALAENWRGQAPAELWPQ